MSPFLSDKVLYSKAGAVYKVELFLIFLLYTQQKSLIATFFGKILDLKKKEYLTLMKNCKSLDCLPKSIFRVYFSYLPRPNRVFCPLIGESCSEFEHKCVKSQSFTPKYKECFVANFIQMCQNCKVLFQVQVIFSHFGVYLYLFCS